MNISEFDRQADVLELVKASRNKYEWRPKSRIWVKSEYPQANTLYAKNAIFASHGVVARSVKITTRMQSDLTMHNALQLKPPDGDHCFIVDINVDIPGFMVITAALVTPVLCRAERTTTGTGTLNRPETIKHRSISFPGVLTEKYLRQTQEEPMSVSEARYLLVTPKAINISVGELVHIGGLNYETVIKHDLDEYKNEYEILRRSDN